MAVFFEEDRKISAARFELKKQNHAKKQKKKARLKTKIPILAKHVRKYLLKRGQVDSNAMIAKFKTVCTKHCFTQEMFRDALRSVGEFNGEVWVAKPE